MVTARSLLTPKGLAPILAVLSSLLTWGLVLIALHEAPGATLVSGTTYDTEFIHSGWYGLTVIGLALVVATAALSGGWGLGAVVVTVAAQWYAAAETVARYQESGWGDGLEVFAYLAPIGWAIVGLLAVGLSVIIRWGMRRDAARRAAAQPTGTDTLAR